MKGLFTFLLFGAGMHLYAQVDQKAVSQDPFYLEDQFYVGITYNFLLDKPTNVTQSNLSYGLHGGFIKDIPVSPSGRTAFGIGLGYAVNSYYTNLYASESGNEIEYIILEERSDYKRNKIETHVLEMPLEFRWRNSTATDYKFWRIYTGIKLGYVFGGRSKLVSKEEKISFSNTDVRDFQYGVTLNFGYNTFNIHAYYALSTLFNDGIGVVGGETIVAKPLRIGIIFYIL